MSSTLRFSPSGGTTSRFTTTSWPSSATTWLADAGAASRELDLKLSKGQRRLVEIRSGNSSVREHVQRLGRVLRKQEGKRALLYELVTADTAESFTSERRREHSAYRGRSW